MNTKEAINYCIGCKCPLSGRQEEQHNEQIDEVIILLQQGGKDRVENVELKKYKAIVKELEQYIKASKQKSTCEYSFLAFIEEIKQKHFQKDVT